MPEKPTEKEHSASAKSGWIGALAKKLAALLISRKGIISIYNIESLKNARITASIKEKARIYAQTLIVDSAESFMDIVRSNGFFKRSEV
jgi:hypothetical protein